MPASWWVNGESTYYLILTMLVTFCLKIHNKRKTIKIIKVIQININIIKGTEYKIHNYIFWLRDQSIAERGRRSKQLAYTRLITEYNPVRSKRTQVVPRQLVLSSSLEYIRPNSTDVFCLRWRCCYQRVLQLLMTPVECKNDRATRTCCCCCCCCRLISN